MRGMSPSRWAWERLGQSFTKPCEVEQHASFCQMSQAPRRHFSFFFYVSRSYRPQGDTDAGSSQPYPAQLASRVALWSVPGTFTMLEFPVDSRVHGHPRNRKTSPSLHRHGVASRQPRAHRQSTNGQARVECPIEELGYYPNTQARALVSRMKPDLRIDHLRHHESLFPEIVQVFEAIAAAASL